VVQLRQDNALGTLYNMVGFQTKLKHGEQTRIFRMIPGPAECRVRAARRPAPQHLPELAALLDHAALKAMPRLRFRRPDHRLRRLCRERRDRTAGRRFAAAERLGEAPSLPPPTTAIGALLGHITGGHISRRRRAPSSR
jgi:methylenetetrahydrofolate--tRNA-(uracil-5-)-methyltransferase